MIPGGLVFSYEEHQARAFEFSINGGPALEFEKAVTLGPVPAPEPGLCQGLACRVRALHLRGASNVSF